MSLDSNELLNMIAQTIYDKKGFNILTIDIRECSTLTDFFILAEGNVDRHVQAIVKAIHEETSKHGLNTIRTEGEKSGDWCVLDYGDVIVHIFVPELRQLYKLEEVWKEGKVVDLEIKLSKSEGER